MFDRVLVGGTFAEHAVGGKPQEPALLVHRADDRIVPFRFHVEPGVHHRHGARAVVVQRRGVLDRLVQDRQDLSASRPIAVDQPYVHVSED